MVGQGIYTHVGKYHLNMYELKRHELTGDKNACAVFNCLCIGSLVCAEVFESQRNDYIISAGLALKAENLFACKENERRNVCLTPTKHINPKC